MYILTYSALLLVASLNAVAKFVNMLKKMYIYNVDI